MGRGYRTVRALEIFLPCVSAFISVYLRLPADIFLLRSPRTSALRVGLICGHIPVSTFDQRPPFALFGNAESGLHLPPHLHRLAPRVVLDVVPAHRPPLRD